MQRFVSLHQIREVSYLCWREATFVTCMGKLAKAGGLPFITGSVPTDLLAAVPMIAPLHSGHSLNQKMLRVQNTQRVVLADC